jgi:hypothetical protein
VLVLACLHLDHEEIEARDGAELLADSDPIAAGRPFTSALARAVVTPSGRVHVPVVLLAPNPRAQPNLHAVRMELLVDVIQEMAAAAGGHWAKGFDALNRRDVKKVFASAPVNSIAPIGTGRGKGAAAYAQQQHQHHALKRSPQAAAALTETHRIAVVRGAKARSSMLVPFDAVRVVRADEVHDLVGDLTGRPGAASTRPARAGF